MKELLESEEFNIFVEALKLREKTEISKADYTHLFNQSPQSLVEERKELVLKNLIKILPNYNV